MRWLLLLIVGCKHTPPEAVIVEPPVPTTSPHRLAAPAPLPPKPFVVPEAAVATLSNGIPVYIVENHEVPLITVRLAFRAGTTTDPSGKEGVAALSASLMNQGAGARNAEAWDRELRRLGTSLGIGSGVDGTSAELTTLTRNLDGSLDLLRELVTAPRFENAEFDLLVKRTRDGLTSRRSDPASTANWVLDKVVWGDVYRGRKMDERSLARITTKDLRTFQQKYLVPGNAAIFVGGDVTPGLVLPLLEARFGTWTAKAHALPGLPVAPARASTLLTLVDKPGAAQSVIVGQAYVGKPDDADYSSLAVANHGIGGQFMSRVNLNLREDKGYTYGARTGVGYDLAGTQFSMNAPVVADKTVPALVEFVTELRASKAVAGDEVANAQGSMLLARPLRFEQPGYLLGQLENLWTYNLPADWVSGYDARVQAVDAAGADGAWRARVSVDRLNVVIVGDLASVGAGLREQAKAWGWAVEERDVDAKVQSQP